MNETEIHEQILSEQVKEELKQGYQSEEGTYPEYAFHRGVARGIELAARYFGLNINVDRTPFREDLKRRIEAYHKR